MKIIKLIILLSLCNSAYAFEINNLKNLFNSLLNLSPKVERPEKSCCDPTAEEIEQINQCAIDLCGYSGTVDSSVVSDEDYENYYKDEVILKDYEEYKPKMEEYLNTIRSETKKEIVAIMSKMSEPDYLNLESYSDEDITSFVSDELSSMIDIEIIKDEKGNSTVDVSILPSNIELDENLKNNYIESKVNLIKNDFSMGVYYDYLSLNEAISFIKNAVSKHVGEIERRLQENSASSGVDRELLLSQKIQYREIEQQIHDLKEPTRDEVVRFYYSIENVDYQFTQDLDLKYYNSAFNSFECNDSKCRDYLTKKITDTFSQKKFNNIMTQINDDEQARDLIRDCEFLWHRDRLRKAKGNKKQEFVEAMPKNIEQIKKKFTSKFSKESSEELGRYLDSLKYIVADDKLPSSDLFNPIEWIKEVISSSTESDEDDLSGVLSDYRKIKTHFISGQPVFDHDLRFCRNADYTGSDHFMPSPTYVYISSFSCNHYTEGRKVLAHELGHALSHAFLSDKTSEASYNKYRKLRKCISDNYKNKDYAGEPLLKGLIHKGDTRYTEEDVADFVASVVYPNPDEGLLSCSLIKKDKNNLDYDRKELAVINREIRDSHSTPFLRTLIEAISKNRIMTVSCQRIIDKYQDLINFNKCEL